MPEFFLCSSLWPQGSIISLKSGKQHDSDDGLSHQLMSVIRQTFGWILFGATLIGCQPYALPPADLVIINGKEPESLDPVIINGQADGRIVSALFEGLTRYNAKTGIPEPSLAQSWEIDPSGTNYRFSLRPDLRWSDGRPLTASDIIYSWRRVLEPASACDYANILFCIENAEAFHRGTLTDFNEVGIRALGTEQLHITLRKPTPYFLDICCYPALGTVPRAPIEKHGDRWLLQEDLPTSGSYRLGFWRLNDRIRLHRNEAYWDRANVRSKTVDILPTSNASTALNLYETGEVDIVWDKELIPTELVGLLRRRADFHVADFLGTYFLRINTLKPPFSNPQVRQALAHAIDRNRLVEKITGAGEAIAPHLVPLGIPNYTSPEGISYNPSKARQWLEDAGFPKGTGFPPIDYLFNSSKLNEQIAVEIQAMWREHLGIETNLRQLEWKSYLQDQTNLKYDVSRSSWIGDYLDPQTFLEVFTSGSGNNRTGWENPIYDALLEKGGSAENTAERMDVLKQAESILIKDAVPIIPLYFYVSMEYYDTNRISGIHSNIRAEHPIRSIQRRDPSGRNSTLQSTELGVQGNER